jgi:preprotein translocase subunit SecE
VAQWGALLVGLGAAVVVFLRPSWARNWSVLAAMPGAKSRRWSGLSQGGDPDDGCMCFGLWSSWRCFLWLTDKTLEWVFYDLILGWRK